jgi:hypothetical protein
VATLKIINLPAIGRLHCISQVASDKYREHFQPLGPLHGPWNTQLAVAEGDSMTCVSNPVLVVAGWLAQGLLR